MSNSKDHSLLLNNSKDDKDDKDKILGNLDGVLCLYQENIINQAITLLIYMTSWQNLDLDAVTPKSFNMQRCMLEC